MPDTNDLLQQIRTIVREENEPVQKQLQEQGATIAQIKTAVEALGEGQKEIRETMATKADVMNVGAKVDKVLKQHDERLEALEKEINIPNPHKH